MHLTAKNDYTARRWPCQEIVAFAAAAAPFDLRYSWCRQKQFPGSLIPNVSPLQDQLSLRKKKNIFSPFVVAYLPIPSTLDRGKSVEFSKPMRFSELLKTTGPEISSRPNRAETRPTRRFVRKLLHPRGYRTVLNIQTATRSPCDLRISSRTRCLMYRGKTDSRRVREKRRESRENGMEREIKGEEEGKKRKSRKEEEQSVRKWGCR